MEPRHPTIGVSECDLLIVVGARFSDRVTGNTEKFAKNAKILQIDIDPAEMNKNVLIDRWNRRRFERSFNDG